MKKISTRSFTRRPFSTGTFTATMFDRVRAAAPVKLNVVNDYYPGVAVPVASVVTGGGVKATFRSERQARRAAFLAMASER